MRSAGYVAQLYAGLTLDTMRPVGLPRPMLTGLYAGLFTPDHFLALPHIALDAIAYFQVRAWELAKGSSYEEARAIYRDFARWPELFPATIRGTRLIRQNDTTKAIEVDHAKAGRVLNLMTVLSADEIRLDEFKPHYEARFINHSCSPNMTSVQVFMEGRSPDDAHIGSAEGGWLARDQCRK